MLPAVSVSAALPVDLPLPLPFGALCVPFAISDDCAAAASESVRVAREVSRWANKKQKEYLSRCSADEWQDGGRLLELWIDGPSPFLSARCTFALWWFPAEARIPLSASPHRK